MVLGFSKWALIEACLKKGVKDGKLFTVAFYERGHTSLFYGDGMLCDKHTASLSLMVGYETMF